MRFIPILFLLSSGLHAVEVTRPAPPPTCDALLKLSSGYQRRIAEMVQRGPASHREAIAYVAMTPQDLQALAMNGVTRATTEFRVYASLENPSVSRYMLERPELRVMAQARVARDPKVEDEAWSRSVTEMVLAKAERLGLHPAKNVPTFPRFFSELRPMHRDLRAHAFSPDFDRIYRAAAELGELPFEEPTTVDTELSERLQELFNAGPNYARLVGRQKLSQLAELFGVAWDDVDAPESNARAVLTGLVADLPGHAGFKVALNGMTFNRVRFSLDEPPKVYSVDVAFVAGIEAYGESDKRYLDDLVAQFPSR